MDVSFSDRAGNRPDFHNIALYRVSAGYTSIFGDEKRACGKTRVLEQARFLFICGFAADFCKPVHFYRASGGTAFFPRRKKAVGKNAGQGGFFRRRPLDNPLKSVQAGVRPPPENHPRGREFGRELRYGDPGKALRLYSVTTGFRASGFPLLKALSDLRTQNAHARVGS